MPQNKYETFFPKTLEKQALMTRISWLFAWLQHSCTVCTMPPEAQRFKKCARSILSALPQSVGRHEQQQLHISSQCRMSCLIWLARRAEINPWNMRHRAKTVVRRTRHMSIRRSAASSVTASCGHASAWSIMHDENVRHTKHCVLTPHETWQQISQPPSGHSCIASFAGNCSGSSAQRDKRPWSPAVQMLQSAAHWTGHWKGVDSRGRKAGTINRLIDPSIQLSVGRQDSNNCTSIPPP